MLRYLRALADKDVALDRSMIPLGSCTMKLNATTEMIPVTWPEFGSSTRSRRSSRPQGYLELIADLEATLCAITGYDAVSLQPNAGSQGELAGPARDQRVPRGRGEPDRDICLIPSSAHGTNAASARHGRHARRGGRVRRRRQRRPRRPQGARSPSTPTTSPR